MKYHFIHDLNKSNFFHSSVITLAYTQFGVNDLLSRGFFAQLSEKFPDRDKLTQNLKAYQFPVEVERQILQTQTLTPKIFVPAFTTKNKQTTYQMEPDTSALQFVSDPFAQSKTNIELTHMTILVAWEKVRALNLSDTPVFQFFRHIRNAAAHNGKFLFKKNVIDKQSCELLKKAEWKNFQIEASMQEMPLIAYDKDDNTNFWDQGDLVEFLLDFENHYPQLKQL